MITQIAVSEKAKGFSISRSAIAVSVAIVFTSVCVAASALQSDAIMYASGLIALAAVNYLDNQKKGGKL